MANTEEQLNALARIKNYSESSTVSKLAQRVLMDVEDGYYVTHIDHIELDAWIEVELEELPKLTVYQQAHQHHAEECVTDGYL